VCAHRAIIIESAQLHEIILETTFRVDMVKSEGHEALELLRADDQSETSGAVHDEDFYLPL